MGKNIRKYLYAIQIFICYSNIYILFEYLYLIRIFISYSNIYILFEYKILFIFSCLKMADTSKNSKLCFQTLNNTVCLQVSTINSKNDKKDNEKNVIKKNESNNTPLLTMLFLQNRIDDEIDL